MGAILLIAGAEGKRYALPNAEVMIHQPMGGTEGQAADMIIHAKRIIQTREILNKIISDRSGQPMERVEKDTDRDFFMTARQALDYGIINKVIEKL